MPPSHILVFCFAYVFLATRCGVIQASQKGSCCGVHDTQKGVPSSGSRLGGRGQSSGETLGLPMIVALTSRIVSGRASPKPRILGSYPSVIARFEIITAINPGILTPSIRWRAHRGSMPRRRVRSGYKATHRLNQTKYMSPPSRSIFSARDREILL